MLDCCLTLFLLLFAQSGTQAHADARVVEVTGNWKLDHKPVSQGMALFYGQTIRLDTRASHGKIVILYPTGEKRSCPDEDRPVCSDLTVQRPAEKPGGILERVFMALDDAFSADSSSVPGLTKSASIPDGYGELRDASLLIHNPGLPPVLGRRTFSLQFRKLGPNNVVGPPIGPNLKWQPGSPCVAGNIRSGLYRVNLLDSDSRPTGDYFLLLVYEFNQGFHVAEDFNVLVTTTDGWGPEEQTTALMLRRLFLWQSAKALGLQEAQ